MLVTKYAGIIVKDNKFLLVRQKGQDYYKNLGGKLEKNETPEECLKREILEEISTIVTETKFYWQLPRTNAVSDPSVELDIYLYFVTVKGQIKPSSEIEECVWLSKSDFDNNKYKLTYQIQEYIVPKLIKDGYIK